MGLLDKALNLPTITQPLDQAVNYSVAGVGQILNEGFSSITDSFGGIGGFTSMSVGAPSFVKLGADYSLSSIAPKSLFGIAASVTNNATSSTASAAQINAETGTSSLANDDHIVKLVSMVDDVLVEFRNMPEVSERRAADYEPLSAPHMPGEFQKYKGTKSTTWNINAIFTCRTREEADLHYNFLRTLRAWVMPYFGENQRGRMLGAPPPVLKFSGWRGLVGTVPVVMTSVNWNWPRDCDWIPTMQTDENGQEIPFPTVMTVNIDLVESFSATQFNGFDLIEFQNGRMVDAFPELIVQHETAAEAEMEGGTAVASASAGGLTTGDFTRLDRVQDEVNEEISALGNRIGGLF